MLIRGACLSCPVEVKETHKSLPRVAGDERVLCAQNECRFVAAKGDVERSSIAEEHVTVRSRKDADGMVMIDQLV